ncbi:DUF1330 domain-containing protein [Aureimonas populi]|uniref:DUF1330 domain-containing protein n=1 Tax=Aureimonas populi TaxID=1701758 RepID=A0ABW5CNV5_9HYPH|nr:DUF1330 domain-containing protein [Aureimonas populi]
MPKAYWIARIDVREPERYPDYIAAAKPAMERYGAKFLARGGPFVECEGTARKRNVVIEFASMEDAQACYESPEYQAARAIREEIADGELVLVEGA